MKRGEPECEERREFRARSHGRREQRAGRALVRLSSFFCSSNLIMKLRASFLSGLTRDGRRPANAAGAWWPSLWCVPPLSDFVGVAPRSFFSCLGSPIRSSCSLFVSCVPSDIRRFRLECLWLGEASPPLALPLARSALKETSGLKLTPPSFAAGSGEGSGVCSIEESEVSDSRRGCVLPREDPPRPGDGEAVRETGESASGSRRSWRAVHIDLIDDIPRSEPQPEVRLSLPGELPLDGELAPCPTWPYVHAPCLPEWLLLCSGNLHVQGIKPLAGKGDPQWRTGLICGASDGRTRRGRRHDERLTSGDEEAQDEEHILYSAERPS